jgi:hypothetical protein
VLTLHLVGIWDETITSWHVLVVPSKTPCDSTLMPHKAFADDLNSLGLETKLVDLNAAVRSSSLQALTQLLASEMSCWSDGIARRRSSGISAQC